MRHGSSSRRQRGRGNGGRRGNQSRAQVYDSNGPDVRIRGTAHQVAEKYVALAKDAASGGDIILAESYLQYAEHYQRIINSWTDNAANRGEREQGDRSQQNTHGNVKETQKEAEDDLSLPSSILGDVSHVETKSTDKRTDHLAET